MKFALLGAVFGIGLLVGGCAKFPDTPDAGEGARLIFHLKVDGKIRFGTENNVQGAPYIYMVALNPSELDNPTVQGPIPVIAPPWGNGFVSGNATHFIWWDPTQASPFTLYKFTNADLTQWSAVGVPINAVDASVGTSELTFEISLRQLIPDATSAAKIRSMQVNFLTMDRAPQSGSTKFWDAIGDGRFANSVNTWITVPLRSNATYDNTLAGDIEPRGDQPDPDLDLVDWSIEVRTQ